MTHTFHINTQESRIIYRFGDRVRALASNIRERREARPAISEKTPSEQRYTYEELIAKRDSMLKRMQEMCDKAVSKKNAGNEKYLKAYNSFTDQYNEARKSAKTLAFSKNKEFDTLEGIIAEAEKTMSSIVDSQTADTSSIEEAESDNTKAVSSEPVISELPESDTVASEQEANQVPENDPEEMAGNLLKKIKLAGGYSAISLKSLKDSFDPFDSAEFKELNKEYNGILTDLDTWKNSPDSDAYTALDDRAENFIARVNDFETSVSTRIARQRRAAKNNKTQLVENGESPMPDVKQEPHVPTPEEQAELDRIFGSPEDQKDTVASTLLNQLGAQEQNGTDDIFGSPNDVPRDVPQPKPSDEPGGTQFVSVAPRREYVPSPKMKIEPLPQTVESAEPEVSHKEQVMNKWREAMKKKIGLQKFAVDRASNDLAESIESNKLARLQSAFDLFPDEEKQNELKDMITKLKNDRAKKSKERVNPRSSSAHKSQLKAIDNKIASYEGLIKAGRDPLRTIEDLRTQLAKAKAEEKAAWFKGGPRKKIAAIQARIDLLPDIQDLRGPETDVQNSDVEYVSVLNPEESGLRGFHDRLKDQLAKTSSREGRALVQAKLDEVLTDQEINEEIQSLQNKYDGIRSTSGGGHQGRAVRESQLPPLKKRIDFLRSQLGKAPAERRAEVQKDLATAKEGLRLKQIQFPHASTAEEEGRIAALERRLGNMPPQSVFNEERLLQKSSGASAAGELAMNE